MGVSRASNLTITLKTGEPLAAGAAELRDPARSLNFGRAASRFIDLRRLCRLIAAFLHCGRRLALLAPEAGAGPRAEQRAVRRQHASPWQAPGRRGAGDGAVRPDDPDNNFARARWVPRSLLRHGDFLNRSRLCFS